MTYFIFLFRAKLRRCTAIFRKIKDRIITKAVRSRRLMRNPSLDRLPYYVYASVRKYSRYRTYESRSTLFIRNPFQTIQKNTVFNIIGCVFPCKSCRINSRSFIEIIDFQPGVIRKNNIVCKNSRYRSRLNLCIFFKRFRSERIIRISFILFSFPVANTILLFIMPSPALLPFSAAVLDLEIDRNKSAASRCRFSGFYLPSVRNTVPLPHSL